MAAPSTPACSQATENHSSTDPVRAFAEESLHPSTDVQQAAASGLRRFLDAIPASELGQFNFSSKDELDKATLGIPFRVFVLYKQDIMRDEPKVSFLDRIHPTSIWFFPVVCQHRSRTILTVDFISDKWKATEIGNSDLAEAFDKVKTRWPSSEEYQYVFVRNYDTLSEIILLIRSQVVEAIPLPNAVSSLGLPDDRVMNPNDLLTHLRKALSTRMAK